MRLSKAILLAIVCLLFLGALVAGATTSWALNGDEWLETPDQARQHYVMGIIDMWMGLYVSWEGEKKRKQNVTLNETDQSYHGVVACILDRQMKYSDVIELVEMHVRLSLEKRDASMSYLALEALHNKCDTPG